MAEDKAGKWRKIILIVVAILLIIILLITFFVGIRGLKQFFLWLFGIIMFLLVIFGILYIFWLIFIKKEYKDIPATYKKKLIQTAQLMKNDMLGDLYLSGDEKHNRIKLGRFKYLRITLPRQVTKKVPIPPDSPEYDVRNTEKEVSETMPVFVDCFVLVKKGVMDTLFGNPIFILVKPEDHNYSSIFNDVTVSGFNLVPLDSQFYTIDKRNLDVDIIKGMATNYIREVVYEIFRDLDRLVKQSINLDQEHIKSKERGLEFDIPKLSQGGGNE